MDTKGWIQTIFLHPKGSSLARLWIQNTKRQRQDTRIGKVVDTKGLLEASEALKWAKKAKIWSGSGYKGLGTNPLCIHEKAGK